MKKLALYSMLPVIALATIPTKAFSADDGSFCGFYTGLALGGSFGTARATSTSSFRSTITGATDTLTVSSSSDRDFRRNSFLGSLVAGYGWVFGCDQYYGGLEVFVSGSGQKRRNHGDSVSVAVTGRTTFSDTISTNIRSKQNSFEWGIDVRPGYLICPNTLFYGRIGAGFNKPSFDSDATYTLGTGVGFAGLAIPASVNSRKHRSALRLGFGLERRFCGCWSLGVDYVNTSYRSRGVSNSTSGSVVIPGGATANFTAAHTTSVKVSRNVTTVRLNYFW